MGKRKRQRQRRNKRIVYNNVHVSEDSTERTTMQMNFRHAVLASGRLKSKRYDKSRLRGHIDKQELYAYVKPRYGVIIKRRYVKTVFDKCMEKKRIM